jgi:hypothetical protein
MFIKPLALALSLICRVVMSLLALEVSRGFIHTQYKLLVQVMATLNAVLSIKCH